MITFASIYNGQYPPQSVEMRNDSHLLRYFHPSLELIVITCTMFFAVSL
jgi:hypothetical protein